MAITPARVFITLGKENLQIELRDLGLLGVGHSRWFCSRKLSPAPAEKGRPARNQALGLQPGHGSR